MNIQKAKVIVLNRTNYGEADKIVNAITSDGLKISYIAKGVRKPKSKLVAGAELFCISDICYTQNNGGLSTLTSAKIISQHVLFLDDLDRVNAAYDVLKLVNRRAEDSEATDYFDLLVTFLTTLNDYTNNIDVVKLWVYTQVLGASGHNLQLKNQTNNQTFSEDKFYVFDYEKGGFISQEQGVFSANHVKFLRLVKSNRPSNLKNINKSSKIASDLLPAINQFLELSNN